MVNEDGERGWWRQDNEAREGTLAATLCYMTDFCTCPRPRLAEPDFRSVTVIDHLLEKQVVRKAGPIFHATEHHTEAEQQIVSEKEVAIERSKHSVCGYAGMHGTLRLLSGLRPPLLTSIEWNVHTASTISR